MGVALDRLCQGGAPGGSPSHGRRQVWSVLCLAAVILTDTLLPNLDTVFGLAGSLGLGLLAFVLPTAAFLGQPERNASLLWVAGACVVLVAGTAMTVGSTARILYLAA